MPELREQIRAAGFLTQKALAEHIGWTEEHLSRVVSGHKPAPLILLRFLEAARPIQAGEE